MAHWRWKATERKSATHATARQKRPRKLGRHSGRVNTHPKSQTRHTGKNAPITAKAERESASQTITRQGKQEPARTANATQAGRSTGTPFQQRQRMHNAQSMGFQQSHGTQAAHNWRGRKTRLLNVRKIRSDYLFFFLLALYIFFTFLCFFLFISCRTCTKTEHFFALFTNEPKIALSAPLAKSCGSPPFPLHQRRRRAPPAQPSRRT